MSADLELWTRKGDDVASHLPRADEWDSFGDEFQFMGVGWMVSVFAPEPVEPYQAPLEVRELLDDPHFRIEIGLEESGADSDARAVLREVMDSLGRGLGGAGVDPETHEPRSWAD